MNDIDSNGEQIEAAKIWFARSS